MGVGSIAKDAFGVFEDVRGAVAMYMFILEEAIQTVGMACYINYRRERYDKCKELAQYCIETLINPLKEFADSPAGNLAYPMNLSYSAFASASKKTMQTYLELEE